jgi:hypothetical protein
VLDMGQKKNKIRNLLQEMAKKDGTVRNADGRGGQCPVGVEQLAWI